MGDTESLDQCWKKNRYNFGEVAWLFSVKRLCDFSRFFFFFLFRLPLPYPLPQLEAAPVPTSSPSTSTPLNKHWIFDCGHVWGGRVDGYSPFFLLHALSLFVSLRKSPNIFCFLFIPIYQMSSKLLNHEDHRIFVKSNHTVSLCLFGHNM